MKLRNLFFAGLALCTFAACSNDDEPKEGNGEAAALTIGIATTSAKADVVGSTKESTISTMEVAIFNADNSFVTKKSAASGAKTVTFDKATSGLKQGNAYKVVVIANTTNAGTSLASYQGLTTTSDDAQADNNFVMSGEATTTLANVDGNAVTVTVARAAAKVNLSSLKVKMTDEVSDVKSFLVKTVYIANGANTSKVYNGTQDSNLSIDAPGFISGLLDAQFGKINSAAALNGNLIKNFDNAVVVTESDAAIADVASFYTLANSRTADNEYAYLVIKGELTYKSGKANSNIFYAVPVKTGETNLINRNTIYNVDATIKGVTGNGNPADLTVTVTVANWLIENQTAELN